MDNDLHNTLIATTEDLRDYVSKYSTESIVGYLALKLISWFGFEQAPRPLVSPMKQVFYLLGLMLTTEDDKGAESFGQEDFDLSVEKLNAIFNSYSLMYWPKDQALSEMPQEWRNIREVAMASFLFHFNTVETGSVEYLKEAISRYFIKFDNELMDLAGISATQCLSVAEWIAHELQLCLDEMQSLALEEHSARIDLLDQAENEGWDEDRLRDETLSSSYPDISTELFKRMNNMFKITADDLLSEFTSQIASSFWELLVSSRGGIKPDEFIYLTQENPAELKPIISLENGIGMIPSANMIFLSIWQNLEKILANSSEKDRYYRHRDDALEEEVADNFRRISKSPEGLYVNVSETEYNQFEHDLIIVSERSLYIIEAKAGNIREPFMDPERAFPRIRDDFRGSTGIQGAYDQSLRLYRRIMSGETVTMYDANRRLVVELNSGSFDHVFCISVTRHNYGPLGVDLSYLLEKEIDDPFPWTICVMDLATLIDTWCHFGWGFKEFERYLQDRILLHGKLFSPDELEVAGYFIEHGGLGSLVDIDTQRVILQTDYSDVFDAVYSIRLGGDQVIYAPSPPIFNQVADILVHASKSGTQEN